MTEQKPVAIYQVRMADEFDWLDVSEKIYSHRRQNPEKYNTRIVYTFSDATPSEPVGYVNENSLMTLGEHSSIGLVAKADSFRALPLFRVAAEQRRDEIDERAFLEVAEWTEEIGYAVNLDTLKKLIAASAPKDQK